MKAEVFNLNKDHVGDISLNESVFAVDPRADIVKLTIEWQRAKARAGTHKTKTISEVSGTTKKPFKQKGTGNARQGSLRSVQMRGGGVAHGPVVRSHAIKLPKKIRKLALKSALSSKLSSGKLVIIDELGLNTPKASHLNKMLQKFNFSSFFIVSGNKVQDNFLLAARNIPNVVCVPQIGANVYDIIKHDCVLLSKEAVSYLEERLK